MAGLQAALRFIGPDGRDAALQIAPDDGDDLTFGGLAIRFNAALCSSFFPIYAPDGRTFGFVSTGGDLDIAGPAWLFTVTYEYDAQHAGGYTIAIDPALTLLAGADSTLPFRQITGSVLIQPRPVLTVASSPIIGVPVVGDKPGLTPYTASCDPQQEITLSAPALVTQSETTYAFIRWNVDGIDQPTSQLAVTLGINGDCTATCIYGLAGDVNGDGYVNIIDLNLVVRSMRRTMLLSRNLRLDVNGDGLINIIDLIVTRQQLGKRLR
ncbi:MAG TPA: dockerin type I domain-containing protein [Planctomycetota bacterium]|nr:dockerin type I domain-containing protein [Planctomycetota bacterium]